MFIGGKIITTNEKCHQEQMVGIFFGILLSAHYYGDGGNSLWSKSDEGDGILSAQNMDQHMKEWRFKEIKKFLPMIFADHGRKNDNPWWQIVSGIVRV